jgi:hypothetical protein
VTVEASVGHGVTEGSTQPASAGTTGTDYLDSNGSKGESVNVSVIQIIAGYFDINKDIGTMQNIYNWLTDPFVFNGRIII